MKIIYIGTPEFACPPLIELMASPDIEIIAVVTAEDKPTGRNQTLTPPPVKILALKNNLTVLQPKDQSDREFLKLITKLKPDFVVVTAYGKILKKDFLKIPKYGCINLHASLLPKYRGASPIEEALLNGDTETGITFIQMSEKLDAGDILLLQRIKIEPQDDAPSLRKKLSFLGARLLPFLLRDIRDGLVTPIPQNEKKASYCRKIKKSDGLIDPQKMTTEQILNRIRAYKPWPECHIILNDKRLKILEAVTENKTATLNPGEMRIIDDKLIIGTKNGSIKPLKIQIEGKKPMSIEDFLRGNSSLFK